jgi:lipoprotein NlpD
MGRSLGGARASPRLAAVLLAAALAACAHAPKAGEYVVQRGDNLYRIALRHGVSVDDLMRANGISDPTQLEVGRRLRIPGEIERREGVAQSATGNGCEPPVELKRSSQERARDEAEVSFAWPIRGRLSTCFGERHSRPHEGIDIAAPEGTPVHAAEAGKVIFSGSMGAYGRIVILKHEGAYASVYAHNSENLVEKGAFVEKGDVVAECGESGNATGPHVHFEIRRDETPDDPMLYLP